MSPTGNAPVGFAAAREGIAALRDRFWVVLALGVVGLLAGLVLTPGASSPSAVALVQPIPLGSNSSVTNVGISTPAGPTGTDLDLEPVLRGIARRTGTSFSAVQDMTIVHVPAVGFPPESPLIGLYVNADSEREAGRIMKAWLASIAVSRRRHAEKVLDRGKAALEKQLDRDKRRGRTAQIRQDAISLSRLAVLKTTLGPDFSVIRTTTLDSESKSPLKQMGIGAVGGLIAGVLLALALALLDGRVRTADALGAMAGPVLADLRTPEGVPGEAHARARVEELLSSETRAKIVAVVPLADEEDAKEAGVRLASILGDGYEVRSTALPGSADAAEATASAGCWAAAAAPGNLRRSDIARLRAELSDLGGSAAGLLII